MATPFSGRASAGDHDVRWTLAADGGARVPAGVYFARLEALGRTSYARLAVLAR